MNIHGLNSPGDVQHPLSNNKTNSEEKIAGWKKGKNHQPKTEHKTWLKEMGGI